MALASSFKIVEPSRRRKRIRVNIVATGNYVTGGDTLDLTATTNPNFLNAAGFASLPTDNEIVYLPGGYSAEFVPGTTLANGKIKVYSAAGTELAAAAYPAVLLGAPWEWEFSGPLWGF